LDKKKLAFAIGGLVIGFLPTFFLTRGYNRTAGLTSADSGAPSAGVSGAGDTSSPGAMVASVRETMERAKNNPNDFDAQIEAARTELKIQRFDGAIDYLKKAYQIDPKNLMASANIANLYFQQKNYLEAEKWYRIALQIKPDEAELLTELAATFIERDPPDPDKAIQSLQFALKIDPKSTHTLTHLTEAYLEKSDAKAAEETLARIRELDPKDEDIATLQTKVDELKAGKRITLDKDGR
jgi:tetratricopeptide (TPR) repeat protein